MYHRIQCDIQNYLREYKVRWFGISFTPLKKPNKLITSPQIQVVLKSRDYQMPPNAFKSFDEVKDYLMKYYVSYRVEDNFCKYSRLLDLSSIYTYADDYDFQFRVKALEKAGVCDLKQLVIDYQHGKHTMVDMLYNNYLTYITDKNFIQDAIDSKASDYSTMSNLLEYASKIDNLGYY